MVNVTEHPELEKKDKVIVKCFCGHKFAVIIERRKQYRKATNFPGQYKHIVDGRVIDQGLMTVIDLSRTGMKIKLNVKRELDIGTRLVLEFRLDDTHRSFIQKEVEVKKVFDQELGVEFTSVHPSDPSDKALGFYMLN
jgi:c-di-GMP-binding flagellar brake protein YcgR